MTRARTLPSYRGANWTVERPAPAAGGGKNRKAKTSTRIPEIYGRRVTYPDHVAASWIDYSGETADLSWLMVVGRGHYKVHRLLVDWIEVLTTAPAAAVPELVALDVYAPGELIPALAATGYAHDYPRTSYVGSAFLDGAPSNWFPVAMRGSSRIFFDIEYPQGLYQTVADAKVSHARSFEYSVRRVVAGQAQAALGPYAFTLTSAGTDAVARWTQIHDVGAAAAGGEWQVQVRETSSPNTSDYSEEAYLVRVGALVGIPALDPATFPDVTTYRVSAAMATQDAKDRDPAFQIDVERKLHRVTAAGVGIFGAGARTSTRVPTSRCIDALAELALEHLPAASVPLGTLAELHRIARLWSPDSMGYSAIHDSEATLADELEAIADHGQIRLWRRGVPLQAYREGRPSSSEAIAGLIVPRLSDPGLGSRSFGWPAPDDPDHVVVRWRDPANRYQPAEVVWPAAGGLRPQVIDLPGCTAYAQAAIRASLEYEARRLSRDRLEVRVIGAAEYYALGALLVVHDLLLDTAGAHYSAQLIGQVTSEKLTLDRALPADLPVFSLVQIQSSTTGAIIERLFDSFHTADRTGVTVTGGAVSAGLPIGATDQLPPQVSIYRSSLETSKQWRVMGVAPSDDGFVTLSLEEYDPNKHRGETIVHHQNEPDAYRPVG